MKIDGMIDVVCVGDIMIEFMLHQTILPPPDTTVVLDAHKQELGGPAFNLCWYLSKFDWQTKIVGPIGEHNQVLIEKAISSAHLSSDGLIPISGDSDFLVAILTDHHHHSIYSRATLPKSVYAEILDRCEPSRCLVLTGSRHIVIRQAQIALVDNFQGEFLAFNPSYSIYEYEETILLHILRKANVTILNKQEAEYACKILRLKDINQLKDIVSDTLILTFGAEGAQIYCRESILNTCSLAAKTLTNAIGAGDAFLAGFLHEKLANKSLCDAIQFGSAMAAYVVERSKVRVQISENQVRQRLNNLSISPT